MKTGRNCEVVNCKCVIGYWDSEGTGRECEGGFDGLDGLIAMLQKGLSHTQNVAKITNVRFEIGVDLHTRQRWAPKSCYLSDAEQQYQQAHLGEV